MTTTTLNRTPVHPSYTEDQTYIMGYSPVELSKADDVELAILECERRIVKGFTIRSTRFSYPLMIESLIERFMEQIKSLSQMTGSYFSKRHVDTGPVEERRERGSLDDQGFMWEPYTRRYYHPALFAQVSPRGLLKSRWNNRTLTAGKRYPGGVSALRLSWFQKGVAVEYARELGLPDTAATTLTTSYSSR